MSALSSAFKDIASGGADWRLWSTLATEDLKHRYRRTLIGIAWVGITFGLFIGVKVVVFGNIMPVEIDEYSLYVTLGFLGWLFISSSVVDGCGVFVNSENWIKGVNTPLSLFIYQCIARNFITFFYSAIAGILIIAYMCLKKEGQQITWTALMVIPALCIYVVNAIWISLVFGVITARFRDILHLVTTGMRIIFFLTPILWMPSMFSPGIRKYADYNPFTHYLAIFRDPVMYNKFSGDSWIIVGAITLIGWIIGLIVFSKYRKRIVFWL